MSRIPLILLPGLPLDAALWEHQAQHLAEMAEVSVCMITQASSMADLARLVLAQAPARFALAGLSMGGYVSLEIMRQAPERVAKLALLDTSARPDTPEQTANRRAAIELARQGRMRHVMAGMIPKLIHADRLGERDLVESIYGQADRVGAEAYERQQTAIMNRADSRPDLPAIRCPTLVICGRQDALTPPEVHVEMADAIPQARFVPFEECGHLAPMERPQAVTALLREWLLYA